MLVSVESWLFNRNPGILMAYKHPHITMIVCHPQQKSPENNEGLLVGGFNPSEKYARQIEKNFPQIGGENNKYFQPPSASHQLPWVLGEISPEAAEPKPATKGPRPAGRTELGPLMALSVGMVLGDKKMGPHEVYFKKRGCNNLSGCFRKWWVFPPNHPFLIEFFHSKPSILGVPPFGTHLEKYS